MLHEGTAMTERSDVNTPLPELGEIKTVVDELATAMPRRLDVAEVHLVLNGQHGGWDLTLLATDQDMQDVTLTGTVGRYGAVEGLTEAGA